MKISKKGWQLLTILTSISLTGIYLDFLLSYNAYLQNPNRFILHEASREAVYFFTEGTPPLIFILSVIGIPFLMLYLVWWYEDNDWYPYRKEYAKALVLFVYLLFVTRFTAGLTWYNLVFTLIVPIVQIVSFICLGIIACFMLLMHLGDKREYKNTNKSYR